MASSETEKFRILVVEDDADTREAITAALRWAGFLCAEAATAERTLQVVDRACPDLVVFDLGLPDADGLAVLKQLRHTYDLPVVVCSGRDAETDRLRGLGLGADDYITKPFSPKELALRVRTVLRRVHAAPVARVLRFGNVEINVTERTVTVDSQPVSLTSREFDLVVYLAQRPRSVVTRQELLEAVWGDAADQRSEATVTEHVRRARAKLGDTETHSQHIRAVRGVGYRLVP